MPHLTKINNRKGIEMFHVKHNLQTFLHTHIHTYTHTHTRVCAKFTFVNLVL